MSSNTGDAEPNSLETFRWQVGGDSVRGAAHFRSGLPNQDSIAMRVGSDGSTPIILSVSDGHGSPKCFRSDIGAKLASEVAVDVTSRFIAGLGQAAASEIKRAAESYLPRDIVATWRCKVAEHLLSHPFSASELLILGCKDEPRSADDLAGRNEFFLAYGATLVLVAVLDSCIFYLQLGDGNVITVSSSGEVKAAMTADPELIANETTSLCMPKAPSLFRSRFHLIQVDTPALIVASTDGYVNSFASTEDFLKSGPDLLSILQRSGMDEVLGALPSWLNASSQDGSGDDVSLGFIWRQPLLAETIAPNTNGQSI